MVVVYRKALDNSSVLVHHGINGQKWGERNGPPYPLGFNAHSTAEKRQNPKSVIDGDDKTGSNRIGLTDRQRATVKKILRGVAITAGVVAVGAMAYSAIESGKLDEVIDSGKLFANKAVNNFGGSFKRSVDKSQLGKSIRQIDEKMVESINSDVEGTRDGSINCFHTTTAYILNSLFGLEVKALGFSGIDEASGLVREGRDIQLYKSIFDKIDINSVEGKTFSQVFSDLKPGSTGVLHIGNPAGHFINFEKDIKGNVSIVDPQRKKHKIQEATRWAATAERFGYSVNNVIDFSNAELRENAEEILRNIVK